MKRVPAFFTLLLLLLALTIAGSFGQSVDPIRFRELREKARNSTLTPEEKAELDADMQIRNSRAQATPQTNASSSIMTTNNTPAATEPITEMSSDAEMSDSGSAQPGAVSAQEQRRAQYAARQAVTLERMRQMGKDALTAATRRAPDGSTHEYFVNNETGNDSADGLSLEKAMKTISKAVAQLKPGDKLNLAATSQPYRETMRLGDNFGGTADKPIVIDGHGATLTGSDPLRLDGWEETGTPGLYKSTKFLSELEEFTDEAKLMRVYFIFDGVMQHMGRSSKGAKAPYKAPAQLQAGEWTYVAGEKAFYIKVNGKLTDAKIEAPYRRNGVAVRSVKIAMTHVIIKNLIVCHVLNDGFNLHGTTQDFLLQNIASYECGDDGISPHETCEVTIDGYWGVGNSTGMANGFLSVTKASNIHLQDNLACQYMSAHGAAAELHNSIIIAPSGTEPINLTNSQGSSLKLDNVQVISGAGGKVLSVTNSTIDVNHTTVVGPDWKNAGAIHAKESVIGGGRVTNIAGGTWTGEHNVYSIAFSTDTKNTDCIDKNFGSEVIQSPGQPFPGEGANPAEFKIPPRPVPNPGAGKFTTLNSPVAK